LDPIGNQTIDELATLRFTATATDPDRPVQTLTYSLDAAAFALGMRIDAATGAFTWKPTEDQGGTSYQATITVTDNGANPTNRTDSETITIAVREANVAPVLDPIGNQSVGEQATLTFTATAADQDRPLQTLTYSLDAAAVALGMQIDAATGAFTWTPTAAQTGSTYQATITVTDNGANPANLTDSEKINIAVNFNPDPVVQAPSRAGSNSLIVVCDGGDVVVIDQLAPSSQGAGLPSGQVLRRQPLDTLHSLTIKGVNNKADKLTVDVASLGSYVIPGGLHFDGGQGTTSDILAVTGTPGADTFVVGSDRVTVNGDSLVLASVEGVEINGGLGNDTYTVAALSVPVAITDGGGVDKLDFSQSTTVGVNIDLTLSTGKPQRVFGAGGKTLALKGLFDDVVGTPNNDLIKGNQLANHIWGRDGNDTIYGGAGDDWLYGEKGDDKLYGDAGNDVLLGGEGGDQLRSISGRDLLIAGLGSDNLYGSSTGDTILIGGTTAYDNNDLALAEIMKEWTSGRKFADRAVRLEAGIPTAVGTISLTRRTAAKANGTVIDDAVRDTLWGAAGKDWFFDFAPFDVVKNKSKNDR
jgi:Ca2+-binding RTX toxin-like protein